MTRAFIFPGQGSQVVGMGNAFFETFAPARQALEEVDSALNQKLGKLINEGPQDDLTLTENAQPALMAVSMAIIRTIEAELKAPLHQYGSHFAGHSLGEYTATCATQVFSLEDTAKLLRIREKSMQAAVPVGEGAMAAIIGIEIDAVEALAQEAAEGQVCVVANDNSPGQIVLSGHHDAIQRAIQLASSKGAKRALPLAVSAPFHCSLMFPAAEIMAEALTQAVMHNAAKPIIANVTGLPIQAKSAIQASLVDQVTGRVRWRETGLSLENLGVTQVIEIGAGKVLTGLIKRINPNLQTMAINTPEDMDLFLKTL